jgi:hypothetical protein
MLLSTVPIPKLSQLSRIWCWLFIRADCLPWPSQLPRP